ncbi:hypothetical protein, partial [Pseudonocardia pini]|uniref:hypothetical protein n=1 Tax=Pseudonocardia pini TaxID=2758030 RepID=UPI0015F004F7
SRAAIRAQLEAGPTPLAFDGLGTGCGLVAFGAMGGLLFCAKTAGAGCAVGGAAMIALAAFC